MPKPNEKDAVRRLRIVNRKARHEYFVVETIEAGIELLGTEVKSIRDGQVDLGAGFANIEGGQIFLNDVHIKPYEFGHQFNHDPRRPRRLLLHRREITRLAGNLVKKGMTLVPLAVYVNDRGLIKVQLGLCRGRQAPDKRARLREETDKREAERAMADRMRR